MKISAFLFVVLLFFGCYEEPFTCNCDTSKVSENQIVITNLLEDTLSYNNMHRVWEIPFLSEYGVESYRLRASHAFSKHTQLYTIIENLPGAKLIVTEHENSLVKKDTTSICLSYEIDISEKDWNKIQSEIQRLCFWSNEINNDNPEVLDGGTWFIEGYDPDKRNCANSGYHINSCYYGADNDVGKVCNIIKKYAQEERLHLYIDGE